MEQAGCVLATAALIARAASPRSPGASSW
jgi:hypothetical protein